MSGELSPTPLTPRHSRRNSWSNPLNFFTKASTVQLDKSSGAPPDLAWRRTLNSHANQVREFSVTFVEAVQMARLGMRMWSYVNKEKKGGRVPPIDPFSRESKPLACHGVPLGGIGGGSIGRGFRGDFRRWQFIPGVCEEAPVLADQFSVFVNRGKNSPNEKKISSVLYPGRPKELRSKEDHWGIGSWKWNLDGQKSVYHGLFPRSWTIYDGEPDPDLKISCRQISPFIPNNYQESSLPCCVFTYCLANTGKEDAEVTLLFTFANSIGGDSSLKGGHYNSPFREKSACGVLLQHQTKKIGAPITFAISALETENVQVTTCPRFSVTGQGGDCTARDMWTEIEEHGKFVTSRGSQSIKAPSYPGTAIGAAVAATVTVPANEKREVVFALAWDSPIVKFNRRSSYYRRYTQYYGQDGNAAPKLAHDALLRFRRWEDAIEEWQMPILNDDSLPEWYRVTLFNELYYLVAGGTIWTDGGPRLEERTSEEWKRKLPFEQSIGTPITRRESERMAGLPIAEAATEGPSPLTMKPLSEKVPAKAHHLNSIQQGGPKSEGAMSGPSTDDAVRRGTGELLTNRLRADVDINSESFASSKQGNSDIDSDAETRGYAPKHGVKLPKANSAQDFGTSASDSDLQFTDTEEQPLVKIKKGEGRKFRAGSEVTSTKSADGGDSSTSQRETEAILWRSSSGISLLQEGEENVGQFLYLEGIEYVMWNTYDVHFYASFALISLFPLLELSVQRDFAVGTLREELKKVKFLMDGKDGMRKVAGSVPHDLGNQDPWLHLNSYNIHDTSLWKDLNCKFVLQVYRDIKATENMQFAHAVWPAVYRAITYLEQFDRDGDGLIENDGFADQTYDAWAVHGVSAYCGGLWLAALQAASAYALLMEDSEAFTHLQDLLERGKVAYEEKLWNGKYFKYDSGTYANSLSIQADQMAGQWYAWSCGLPPLFPNEKARSALKTVFENNVMKVGNGRMGAVNGMHPDGRVDKTCMQSREIWTGVTYSAAAAMMYEGLHDEAFKTAEGIYQAGWQEFGYWFQTPEAWTTKGHFRSLTYMRPLAIWAMQWAISPPKSILPAGVNRLASDRELPSFPSLAGLTSALIGRRSSSKKALVRAVTCGYCGEGKETDVSG